MDFDYLARTLAGMSARTLRQRLRFLQEQCPGLIRQVRRDRGQTGPFPFWGRSVNVDEIAGEVIVAPSILEVLAVAADLKMSLVTPNAGLQHTYGYFLSTIQTPFGKKRDRWVEETLEQAFEQPTGTFGLAPSHGTLLANATWLAGQIAFRHDDRMFRMQRCLRNRISPSLQPFDWEKLRPVRLVETVELKYASRNSARIDFVTDIVRVPAGRLSQRSSPNLLVYSVRDSRNRSPTLVTLFLVSDEFLDSVKERGAQRRSRDIRPRYNAYISGFPAEAQQGSCRLLDGG